MAASGFAWRFGDRTFRGLISNYRDVPMVDLKRLTVGMRGHWRALTAPLTRAHPRPATKRRTMLQTWTTHLSPCPHLARL
jgi:hypothetical protein